MERAEFVGLIERLYRYFDRKNPPGDDQVTLWMDEVQWIPTTPDLINSIEKTLRQEDSLLGNFPKKVKKAYFNCKKSSNMPIVYELDDDPRFPVRTLWTSLSILEDSGREAFNEYCARRKMPQADRDRVLAKFNKIYPDGAVNKLAADVGLHINPGERSRQNDIPF